MIVHLHPEKKGRICPSSLRMPGILSSNVKILMEAPTAWKQSINQFWWRPQQPENNQSINSDGGPNSLKTINQSINFLLLLHVTLEPLSTLCVSFFFFSYSFFLIYIFIADNISISMYIMCYTMLVQRFEPQGRRFTNFHYYYLLLLLCLSLSVCKVMSVTVKVCKVICVTVSKVMSVTISL